LKAAGSATSEGTTHKNEDRSFIKINIPHPDGKTDCILPSFLAVYDGHGGSTASDWMSENFHHYIFKKCKKPDIFWPKSSSEIDSNEIISTLKEAAFAADKELIAHLKEKKQTNGSCGLFVVIVGDTIFVGEVGDARAIVGRSQGLKKLLGCSACLSICLTEDQNVENKEEVKRMEKKGGKVKDGRVFGVLKVTRVFGDPALKIDTEKVKSGVIEADAEITTHKIKSSDFFILLASDGFFDVWKNQKLIDVVNSKMHKKKFKDDVEAVCDEVINTARKWRKKTTDDMTIVIGVLRGVDAYVGDD